MVYGLGHVCKQLQTKPNHKQ
uniref:Uncharacterized protein n=1 Tax=Rhizophora mucronata TaxID=61149 RepID=A0A2P2PGW6_RHIMU